MATKPAVIYYSATGTTYQLARAVEQGAGEAGADVRFRKVRELAPEEAIVSNQGWAAHRPESQLVMQDGECCSEAISNLNENETDRVDIYLKRVMRNSFDLGMCLS